jgi:hypothetical protein
VFPYKGMLHFTGQTRWSLGGGGDNSVSFINHFHCLFLISMRFHLHWCVQRSELQSIVIEIENKHHLGKIGLPAASYSRCNQTIQFPPIRSEKRSPRVERPETRSRPRCACLLSIRAPLTVTNQIGKQSAQKWVCFRRDKI